MSIPSYDLVLDIHSAMNVARMRVHHVTCVEDVCSLVRSVAMSSSYPSLSLCGGRHAMGGQQFCDGGDLLDLRGLTRVLELDMDRGMVRVEAGIQWPDLIREILAWQRRVEPGEPPRWGIAQKQTGANALTLGGAVSANIHGRGLLMGPIVNDVESFTLDVARERSIAVPK